MFRPIMLIAVVLALPGCGGKSPVADTSVAPPQVDCVQFVTAAAPRDTPDWLINRTCRIASGLGDTHPKTVAIRLNLRERGRLVDRVWMQGSFTSECPGLNIGTCHWKLVGYTFDAHTRQDISSSLRGR